MDCFFLQGSCLSKDFSGILFRHSWFDAVKRTESAGETFNWE